MSTETHLVQFMPDQKALLHWAASHGFMPGEDLGYGLHAILKACFGERAPRSFIHLDSYRGHGKPHVLAYSPISADELKVHAGLFGEPLAMAALGVEECRSKRFPTIAAGTVLGLEVVTRPVVREERMKDGVARTTEHDPYMLAKMKAGGVTLDRTRDQIYVDWLEGRLAERGLDVDAMEVVGRRQVSVARRNRSPSLNATRLDQVSGQEVRYLGLVRVVDAEAFNVGLPQGVGRHRAFGYGMIVIRPPSEVVALKAA